MNFLNNLAMKSKIVLLASVFAIGFLMFGVMTFRTIALSKIGSPIYEQLVDAKALRADILPPPGYIVETYLMSHLIQDAADESNPPSKLEERLAQYNRLKNEYKTFVETWEAKLPEGEIRDDLLKSSREPAEEFYAMMDNEFLPAIKAKDFDKASDIIDNKLPPAFEKHYKAMMDVVEHVNQMEVDTQAKADQLVASNSWSLCIIGFIVMSCVIGFSWWIRGGVARQEAVNLDFAGQIAAISRSQAVIEFDMNGTVCYANENFLKTWATPSKRSRGAIIACSWRRASATHRPTKTSGQHFSGANTLRPSANESAKVARFCGCRLPTTRSWMPAANLPRSSSLLRTQRRK